MNLGIQHSARPGDFKSRNMAGGLPKEVVAMAKQMGLDMKELGPQAENMWVDSSRRGIAWYSVK